MGYRLRMFKKLRMRNGVREALFGGYAAWYNERLQRRFEREVWVWAPASIQDDDCGAGTDEIVNRLTAKARKRWPHAEIRESWRY